MVGVRSAPTQRADALLLDYRFAGEPTKQIVADHLNESAMYGGAIVAHEPRYCPSIEDKIVRFPNAERHRKYLPPRAGLETSEAIADGLGVAADSRFSSKWLHSVPGLGARRNGQAGYAIRYDYYPTDATLRACRLEVMRAIQSFVLPARSTWNNRM
jgi:tRNA uridine 5-carboxymethylaminomethyl modification enzyme